MAIRRNPIKKSDHRLCSRNVFCPHQNECLDIAAKNLWPAFDCSRCRHKNENEPLNIMNVINDGYPYYQVLPDFYRKSN